MSEDTKPTDALKDEVSEAVDTVKAAAADAKDAVADAVADAKADAKDAVADAKADAKETVADVKVALDIELGISTPQYMPTDAQLAEGVYTISGQRVQNVKNLRPGLYIVAGKKFFVK